LVRGALFRKLDSQPIVPLKANTTCDTDNRQQNVSASRNEHSFNHAGVSGAAESAADVSERAAGLSDSRLNISACSSLSGSRRIPAWL
jgi:hypothetical protein